METKDIARLICQLIESRGWQSWKSFAISDCTCLSKGQMTIGITYLNKKGYIKKDYMRGRRWWTKTKKFVLWKMLLGIPKTKLDMSTGKLVYA